MNVVFFGTASFGLPSLEAIAAHPNHRLVAIVTGPDKPMGRGLSTSPTSVGSWAEHRPERLQSLELVADLQKLNADVYAVVAYRILPEAVFAIPRYAFNLHASLLPAFRGAAPIQRAIMAGETRTGVTTFLLEKTVDTGSIVAQRETQIGLLENAGDLTDRLSRLGAELVIETLEILASGRLTPRPQNSALASPAPKIGPADQILDFDETAAHLINRVRALAPRPGATVGFQGKVIKIFALRDAGFLPDGARPGSIVAADPKAGLLVAARDRVVSVARIQPPGRKVQTGAEFVRGYHVSVTDRFEPLPEHSTLPPEADSG
ncbi:MAG: methionyl-tRNA formyltransferase [candidate division Zixibacteria bacterium]|nr:methionyl-tRNA formyltransferase [candidate division Zixibacteria bacterium]